MIALRHQESALTCGDLEHLKVAFDEEKKWLRLTRGPIEIVFNCGESDVELAIVQRYEAVLTSSPDVMAEGDRLRLPKDTVAVLRNLDFRPWA